MFAAWQDWIVMGAVAAAGVYLVRRLFLPKRTPGAVCCSGCEQCPAVGTRLISLGPAAPSLNDSPRSTCGECAGDECSTDPVSRK